MYKVVYNRCFGGFGLSKEAYAYLNDKYNSGIDPEYGYINDGLIQRHDPRLVEVVEVLGKRASGSCANLKIEEIHTPMYRISEYDGFENVETPDSLDWVVINNVK